jgi:hypothetical protein
VASTGDVKWRPSGEILSGWVKLNGTTIGSAASGATQRANADTQALFIWLWTNFPQSLIVVSTGRGATALADFNANKTITVHDLRSEGPLGLADMGSSDSGLMAGVPILAGTSTTPGSYVGEQTHSLVQGELPVVGLAFSGNAVGISGSFTGNAQTQPLHDTAGHGIDTLTNNSSADGGVYLQVNTGTPSGTIYRGATSTGGGGVTMTPTGSISINNITPSGTVTAGGSTNLGSGTAGNRVSRHVLGTWWIKLASPSDLHICDMLTCLKHEDWNI